jgi:hypothetical protein
MVHASASAPPNLSELRLAAIGCLVKKVQEGHLRLNRWQVFCLTTWWHASGRRQPIPPKYNDALKAPEAESLFNDCIAIALYSYHPETDSFAKEGESPGSNTEGALGSEKRGDSGLSSAPSPVPPTVAPGSGILYHVARGTRAYRTRMIHVDMRTHNSLDDVRCGWGDVIYCPAGGAFASGIVAISAPVPGLLDGLPIEEFEDLVNAHVGEHVQTAPASGGIQPVSIAFPDAASFPQGLLSHLVRPNESLETTSVSIAGIVMATVREREADPHNRNRWYWRRHSEDFAPIRLARAIIRARHLGSVLESYRSKKHIEIDEWSQEIVKPLTAGKATLSEFPGMDAYERALFVTAVRLQDPANNEIHGLIRIGFSGQPGPETSRVITWLEHTIGGSLATLITSLRRRFRGTVARAHLCWDLERSLLIHVADHLTGNIPFDIDEFSRSLGLLHSMLADVEVDSQDSEVSPVKVIERTDLIATFRDERTYNALPTAIVVAPWLFRRGYRVAQAHQLDRDNAERALHRRSAITPIPQSAVYVAVGAHAFQLADDEHSSWRDTAHREDGSEYEVLVRAASSRDYLVALQSFLSSLLASRPTVRLLKWRKHTPTVDLIGTDGDLETVTFDLPLGDQYLEWLEILIDDKQHVITLHHNNDVPFYKSRSWHSPFDSKDGENLRNILCRRDVLPAAGPGFRAVAVVWLPVRKLGIPVSVALPARGEALRQHLIEWDKRKGPLETSLPTSRASFSLAYAGPILRHGWYRQDYYRRWRERGADLSIGGTLESMFSKHLISLFDADRRFIEQYLQAQFAPAAGDKAFPFGLKPFGRQFHVYPVSVGPDNQKGHFLLSIITDWEQERVDAETRYRQYVALYDHVAVVVRRHGGTMTQVVTGVSSHLKYERGSQVGVPVDPREYEDIDRRASRFDVVVFQRKPGEDAQFLSQHGKEPGVLTLSELEVLVVFAKADGNKVSKGTDRISTRWESLDKKRYPSFKTMRSKLEPGHNFKHSTDEFRQSESPYWDAEYMDRSISHYYFKARYLIVVADPIRASKADH